MELTSATLVYVLPKSVRARTGLFTARKGKSSSEVRGGGLLESVE